MSTVSATFHRGTEVAVVDGLEPATPYEHHGIAYTTLPRPAGALRCRVATVNDVHFGETEAGRIGPDERGPILRVPPGTTPYPELMNRAAVAELLAADDVDPFAAVIAKGDLTADGLPEEFAAFEECYRTPFAERLYAVRGNHDCIGGQDRYSGDQWIELDGLAIALVDTAVPGTSTAPSAPSKWSGSTHMAGDVDRPGGRDGPPPAVPRRRTGRPFVLAHPRLERRPRRACSPGARRSSPTRPATPTATASSGRVAACRASRSGA